MNNLLETKLNKNLKIVTTKIKDGKFDFTGLYETMALLPDGAELGCVRCDNEFDAKTNHYQMAGRLASHYIREEAY